MPLTPRRFISRVAEAMIASRLASKRRLGARGETTLSVKSAVFCMAAA